MMSDKDIEKMLEKQAEGSRVGARISFARANMGDVERYRKMSDKELEDSFCGLYWVVHVYGQSSVRDCQLINLMEIEVGKRKNEASISRIKKRMKEMDEEGYTENEIPTQ